MKGGLLNPPNAPVLGDLVGELLASMKGGLLNPPNAALEPRP